MVQRSEMQQVRGAVKNQKQKLRLRELQSRYIREHKESVGWKCRGLILFAITSLNNEDPCQDIVIASSLLLFRGQI